MSLHEPVPPLQFAPAAADLPADRPLVAAWRLLGWLWRRPQQLRDYEYRWLRGHHRERMPPFWPTSAVLQRWSARNRHYDFFITAVMLALGITCALAACITCILYFGGRGVPLPEIALMAASLTVVSFAIGLVLLIVLAPARRGVSGAWLTATFVTAIGMVPALLVYEILADRPLPRLAVLLLAGAWFGHGVGLAVSVTLAYRNAKLRDVPLLIVSAGAVTLLPWLLWLFPRVQAEWPLLPWGVGTLHLVWVATGVLLGYLAGVLHVSDWLRSAPWRSRRSSFDPHSIPFVTPLPPRWLAEHLDDWLEDDWKQGIRNGWQLWDHTRQQHLVSRTILRRLYEAPTTDRPATSVAAIIEGDHACDWRLFFSNEPGHAPFQAEWNALAQGFDEILDDWRMQAATTGTAGTRSFRRRKQRRMRTWSRTMRLPVHPPSLAQATPTAQAIAGFWYLNHLYIDAAADMFARMPNNKDDVAGELASITEGLRRLSDLDDLTTKPAADLPKRPEIPKRKNTWDTFDEVNEMIRCMWLYRQCEEPARKAWCFAEANQRLDDIGSTRAPERGTGSDPAKLVPPSERHLFVRLVELWRKNLQQLQLAPPPRQPMRTVENPFYFSEPLRPNGSTAAIVARDGEIADLKSAWNRGNYQTVVISGQPFIGKTSLVLNAALEARANVEVVWFKPSHIHDYDSPVKQLLVGICDAVGQSTATAVPQPAEAAWNQDAYRACEHYLAAVCGEGHRQSVIIVIDDYDLVDQLFPGERTLDECLRFLAHLHQSIERLGLVLVTRHLPERLRDRQTNPFAYASRDIRLTYLGEGKPQAEQAKPLAALLNGRLKASGLRFDSDAIEYVYALTHGHPYLASLIGYYVLHRFNEQVVIGKPDPLFTRADVEAGITAPGYRNYSARYCSEVYQNPAGTPNPVVTAQAQTVLRLIAKSPPELAETSLANDTVPIAFADKGELQVLLDILARQGHIQDRTDGNNVRFWSIRVGILQQWLYNLP